MAPRPLTSSGKLSRSRAGRDCWPAPTTRPPSASGLLDLVRGAHWISASSAVSCGFLASCGTQKTNYLSESERRRERINYCSQFSMTVVNKIVSVDDPELQTSGQRLGHGGAYGRRQPAAPGARGVGRRDEILAHFQRAMRQLAGPRMGIERVFIRGTRRVRLVVADHQLGIAAQLGQQRLGQARIVVPQHADMPG